MLSLIILLIIFHIQETDIKDKNIHHKYSERPKNTSGILYKLYK